MVGCPKWEAEHPCRGETMGGGTKSEWELLRPEGNYWDQLRITGETRRERRWRPTTDNHVVLKHGLWISIQFRKLKSDSCLLFTLISNDANIICARAKFLNQRRKIIAIKFMKGFNDSILSGELSTFSVIIRELSVAKSWQGGRQRETVCVERLRSHRLVSKYWAPTPFVSGARTTHI